MKKSVIIIGASHEVWSTHLPASSALYFGLVGDQMSVTSFMCPGAVLVVT